MKQVLEALEQIRKAEEENEKRAQTLRQQLKIYATIRNTRIRKRKNEIESRSRQGASNFERSISKASESSDRCDH